MSSLKVTMWKAGQTGPPACPGLVNASVVCVTWQDACPRERNSFIRAYTLRGNQGVINIARILTVKSILVIVVVVVWLNRRLILYG